MELRRKLGILADAAKYDASCASSGLRGRDSRDGKGLGSVTGTGICHAYTPDGRCVSLLKILLTNWCVYDCAYCVSRSSSNVPRAAFTVDEVVRLTLDFYRRNHIEGLFLSSGIARSPDHTMERLVRVARTLREEHRFRGYIHLKTIPEASPDLIALAGRYADYGFSVGEILAGGEGGMLDLSLDPKLAWALKHRERFPVDPGRASREDLLRVPGLGRRTVDRILKARRLGPVRLADLARLGVHLQRAAPFLATPDHRPRGLDGTALRRLVAPPRQLELLAHA